MNKQTSFLIKEYITKTLEDIDGISPQAYKILSTLMQEDRDFALEMHDVIDRVGIINDRYKIVLEEDALMDIDHGYEL